MGITVITLGVFFLVALSLGAGLFTPLASTRLTGVGLLKVMNWVGLAGLALCFALSFWGGESLSHLGPWPVLAMGAFALALKFHRDEKTPQMWGLYLLHNIVILGLIYSFASTGLETLYLFSSALLVGITTYAMILGHWYLVTPKLSTAPLERSLFIFWPILMMRILMSVAFLLKAPEALNEGTSIAEGYLFNWIVFLMRIAWGEIILGVLSYYTWKLIRMRSIQSATGILYVMVFFVFIGELMAMYFFFKHGLLL